MSDKNISILEAARLLHDEYLYLDWFHAVDASEDCLYVYCKHDPTNITLPETFKGFPVIPSVVGEVVVGS